MPEDSETPDTVDSPIVRVPGRPRQRIDMDRAFGMYCRTRNYHEVARELGCSFQAVQQGLTKYRSFLDQLADVDQFRRDRLDIMSAAEAVLLRSCLDSAAIEKAPLAARATTYGILNERRRLEEGKSTQNLLHGAILRIQRDALELTVKGSAKSGVSPSADGVTVEADTHSTHTNTDDIAAK